MKGKKVLNWMIVLLAAFMISSCGKDNKAGDGNGGDNNSPNNNISSSTTAGSSQSFPAFIDQVAAGNFRGGDTSVERRYFFQRYYSGDASNDDWFRFELNFNSSSCNSYQECQTLQNQNYPGRLVATDGQVYRSSSDSMFNDQSRFGGSLQSLKDNLVAMMRSATDIRMCVQLSDYWGRSFWQCGSENEIRFRVGTSINSTRWLFRHGDYYYLVDTQYPLAANPILIQDANSSEGYQVIRY